MTPASSEEPRDTPPAPAPQAPAPEDAEAGGPGVADVWGAALGSAARRAGLDPQQDVTTGRAVWGAIGGWRGIVESVLPSLAFLVLYTVTQNLVLSLAVSVGLAVVFTVIRLVARSSASAAIGGLVATVLAAALALWTGRAEDNFVLGFVTNAIYGSAFLVSALIGWSLIGLAVGFLVGDGTAWRRDPRRRRVFFWLAIAWASLFAARLIVQLPLYFAGDVTALGTTKLIMGIPLFAPLIAVTWLVVRALYPTPAK